ncbi:Transcriptional regulator, partial [Elasticomyces elasticus]
AYIEPFVRPLMEEDIAWLKEKGDRVTPFIMPPRGKKHYKDIWSEEDGALGLDRSNDERLPLNQGRGTIEQISDESAETDQVSVGPMVSRLYSLLRYEHRAPAEEGSTTNGAVNGEGSANGGGTSLNGDSMEIDQPLPEGESKPALPSATAFPDASPTGFKVPAARLDHAQLDERLKAELRHVGFIGQGDNPDYDAHYDDDIAQRLRLLQSELKKQILTNNARKARILDIARERMAYQEYTTIHDDLDTQVQQAYLKRSRTLGKSKKGSQAKNRPGAAGAAGAAGANHVASVSRPAIGDVARTLMDRRKRWEDCIGPVFRDCKTTVPGRGETVFDPAVMAEYEKTEVEDEEQE